jgi:DNA-binding SARP family transcriptional activator
MDLQLLGPVEASFDGRPIPLGAVKQRALLAMLALGANTTVPVDRLIDGLWGEDPPDSALKMVQLYVSQLRRLFAGNGAEIVTHGRGYELRLDTERVDAARFERLVERAGRSNGEPNDDARAALALWQGAALSNVAGEPFAAPEIRRLDDLWLRASELVVDSDLAAARDDEALAQLERLIDQNPLRERLYAQRMLALYRSGRQAEALDAYVAARRRLVDEVGVEPGAELRELHERILGHDPGLELPSVPTAPEPARDGGQEGPLAPRAERRAVSHRVLLAAGALLVVGIAVFALTRLNGADQLRGIHEGAVGVIDARAGAIEAESRLGSEPGAVAAGAGSVWIAAPRE